MKRLLLILWLLTAAAGSRTSAAGRTELNQGWKFRQYGLGEWLPAAVPGTVHTDLLANGQIPDPFYGSSQSDLQWIDKTDWEYCCTFDAPELASYDNVRLVFEGVDCYADIRLNGELLHRTGNMFRTWKSDVKGLLKSRNNRLHVVFHSPVMQGLKNMAAYGSRLTANNDLGALGGLGPNKVSVFTRKSGYQYGWDLAPRYVTSGLWRPVALEAWNEARVEDFHVRTRSTGPRKAQMSASAALRTDAAGCYRIRILLNGKSILTADKTLDAGTHSIEEPFEIPSPRLWYPNGMGEPYLYDVELVLEKEGRELDRTAVRCGVRTVSLRCRDDADGRGRGFGFEINGIPVFCKGSNYVPADAFLPRISREKTEFLVRSAAQANMNMLRVWGGGTYESDDFYEMCDRYGIMVWQDFVFACNMYPGSAQIYADIRAEAEDNVRRLRNHPSLVLWCGNNEIDVAWKPHDKRNSRFRKFYTEEEAEQFDRVNETIFRNILPGVVDSLCGGTVPYWHSSPSPGWGLDTADRWRYGDVHNWDVWHKGDPISAYNTQIARFISEYGLQSYPELSSVERFIPEGERRLASPSMTSHQGDRKKGDARMLEYVDRSYLRSDDFARTLYLSQLMQAEGMKTAMEAHRRNMPYCMGSLIWQLNDVWPCASWSGIDYYGRWKAMHYFVRKACEPVVVSPYIQGDTLDIFVVSDLRQPLRGVMKLTLTDFSGNKLKSSSHPVTVGAAASQRALRYGVRDYLDGTDPGNAVLVCEFRSDKTAYRALQYFETMKNAALPAAAVRIRAEKPDAATCRITVSSDKLAKNLTLHYKGTAGIFSDNYFDLLPGESRSVTLTAPEDAAEILRHIECMALNPQITIIKP